MKNLAIILCVILLGITSGAALAQQQGGGGLGGVLDALGGLLGGGTQKLHGTVVVAHDTTLVVRGDDKRTYRIDTASIDPGTRQGLTTGQAVDVTVRGSGQGVLTATELTPGARTSSQTTFNRVTGTIQESSASRVLFKTRDGLTLPVDVSQIRGLPYLPDNQPATLFYEQGPQQNIVAVWIEPGDAQTSTSPTSSGTSSTSSTSGGTSSTSSTSSGTPSASPTSAGSEQRVQGLVESVGMGTLRLQQSGGDSLTVDVNRVDRSTVEGVRPGDIVTVVGSRGDGGTFVAQSIQKDDAARR